VQPERLGDEMKIELGKRYVNGRGKVTGPMEPQTRERRKRLGYYWKDPKSGLDFTNDGYFMIQGGTCNNDLIREYRSQIPGILLALAFVAAMLAVATVLERTFPDVEYLDAGGLTENDRSYGYEDGLKQKN